MMDKQEILSKTASGKEKPSSPLIRLYKEEFICCSNFQTFDVLKTNLSHPEK